MADDTASDPQVTTEETATTAAETTTAETTTTETQPEAAVETAETTTTEAKPVEAKRPWYLDRIAEEATKRRAADARAEAAERAANDAKDLAARLQDPKAATTTKTEPVRDFDTAVKEEADRRLFLNDTISVRDAGKKEFPDFADSLALLTSLNATNDDFVQDVLAVDKGNAHKILDKLAKDPEHTLALVNMNSRQRIAELTRISMTTGTTAKPATETNVLQPKISKAPAPRPVLEAVSEDTGGDPLKDYDGKTNDDDFSKAWDAKYKPRKTA